MLKHTYNQISYVKLSLGLYVVYLG